MALTKPFLLVLVAEMAFAHPGGFNFRLSKVVDLPDERAYVPPSNPAPAPPPATYNAPTAPPPVTYDAPIAPHTTTYDVPEVDISDNNRNSELYNAINTKTGRVANFVSDLVSVIGGFVAQTVRDLPDRIEVIRESIPPPPPPPRKVVRTQYSEEPSVFVKTYSKVIG